MQKKTSTKKHKDENELAKSILDDIIEETESEDWNKPVNKKGRAKKESTSKDSKRKETSTI